MKLGANMLPPIFENIPRELKNHDQWVVWKDAKIPYDPRAVNSKASVINPSSWGSFEDAKVAYEEGGWLGIGYVLNGTGIVGVDLDKCVIDGTPSPASLAILEGLGTTYIELSPSGTGLHAYGFAENLRSGTVGNFNNVVVELYSNVRYLTITGHSIKRGPLQRLFGFAELADKILGRFTQETQDTQETQSNSYVSCVAYVSCVKELTFPENSVPTGVGQRNKAVFNLARWLKGVEPDCSKDRQREILRHWHDKHLNVIGTKDFGETWVDFSNALRNIKRPYGETLNQCLNDLPPAPALAELDECGPSGVYLMRICLALQKHHQADPFYLSSRIAGQLLGCSHSTAAGFIKYFLEARWLILVEPGNRRKASTYRLGMVISPHNDVNGGGKLEP